MHALMKWIELIGLCTLIIGFLYGLQNGPMIDIMIVKDSILVGQYSNKIKFHAFCNMSNYF
jgi:hypothetical protein